MKSQDRFSGNRPAERDRPSPKGKRVYRLAKPAPELSGYVDSYWMVHSQEGETYNLSVDVYVDGQADFVVNGAAPYRRVFQDGSAEEIRFSGVDAQRTRPMRIEQQGEVRVAGIRFVAGGLAAFTGCSLRETTDRAVPLDKIFSTGTAELEEQVLHRSGETAEQAACFDRFLLSHLKPTPSFERFWRAKQAGEELVAEQIPHLTQRLPQVAVLADRSAMTVRSLERLFSKHLGLSPKFYLRVCRFQNALRGMMENASCDIGEIAIRCGYADQSHLVREFYAFAGGMPRRYRGYLPETGKDFAPNVVRYHDEGETEKEAL